MIYVRWFPGDYLRDTIHLSWLEDCAYRRLLDLYYTQGRALTANRKVLYRQVRATTPEEMGAVESVLAQFFFERRGNVFNSRASKELRRNNEITALRVKAAKAKASKAANALHMHTTSSAIPEPEPEPEGPRRPDRLSQDQTTKLFSFSVSELTLEKLDSDTIKFIWDLDLDPGIELAAFKDFHREHGNKRSDWIAGFRNWCRRSKERKEKGNGKAEDFVQARARRTKETADRIRKRADEMADKVAKRLPEHGSH